MIYAFKIEGFQFQGTMLQSVKPQKNNKMLKSSLFSAKIVVFWILKQVRMISSEKVLAGK